ncbi:hypothetical protein B447_17481 [Thauera sp. 27]|uniref:hypothetical protein n=1 Tax=Thauera sp. 27 TaxID=305700 RepID=UPI0002CDE133|nr:hypothetical protein [Thauera sp. 27]ENO76558.1 hypothetical protein B447_17481 [Thauera sp. 27]
MRNPLSPIVRLARHLRLQAAEADLAYMEARGPAAIAQQRAHVNRLRAAVQAPPLLPISTEAIRRRIERNAKQVLL